MELLAQDYVNAIKKANGTPLLDKLNGILISGGHDVGPENYNQRAKYCGTVMPMRDAQDLAISRYVASHAERSLLGICGGIQILNVAFGGILYQDVESESGFEPHFGDIYPHNYPWHFIQFKTGSALATVFEKEQICVNPYHHQAVCTPGKT